MQKDPWFSIKNCPGPFPEWDGLPRGCKEDGGGCHRPHSRIGSMVLHHAVFNKDREALVKAIEKGADVNEVEAAGNTPLHNAAWSGWGEGVQLLLALGAKANASNNAGDRPIHLANIMHHDEIAKTLRQSGAVEAKGDVIVQDHVNKVKDFYAKACWRNHPKPYADFIEFKRKEHERLLQERNKLIPGL